MSLTLLLGGARSGKSTMAVRLADSTARPVMVVATGEARDDEMAERIRAHREARPPTWTTIEEPVELERALAAVPHDHAVIVDCLSLWVSNAFEAEVPPDQIVERSRGAARSLAARPAPAFAVSNEVGMGIVPANPLARAYRDTLGRVNAAWASAADRAVLVVAGRALPLLDATEGLAAR